MATTITIALVGFALALIAIFLWARREFEVKLGKHPRYTNHGVYRLLERLRDQLFGGSRDVRFTLFRLDPEDPERLLPVTRLGWGRAASDSGVRFRKGEGLAGQAWAQPGRFLVAKLGEFDNLQDARTAHEKLLNLDSTAAAALSIGQLESEILVAVSLCTWGDRFSGVLSIDSRRKDLIPMPETNPQFWTRLRRISTELGAMVEPAGPAVINEPVREWSGASIGTVTFGNVVEDHHRPLEAAR